MLPDLLRGIVFQPGTDILFQVFQVFVLVRLQAELDRGEVFDVGRPAEQLAAVARAEWFVTDWFTSDGSQATVDSLVDAVASPAITWAWGYWAPVAASLGEDDRVALMTFGLEGSVRLLPERFSPFVRVAVSYAHALGFTDASESSQSRPRQSAPLP